MTDHILAEKVTVCSCPMKPHERATLELRLNDLLKFLNAPGDWGYGTPMADLTLYLLEFRQKLAKSENRT